MSENRPSPLKTIDLLRSIIECWLELDRELTRNTGAGSRGKREGAVPLDLDVLEAKRAIDTFAHTYCHMLMDETNWTPAALNTPALLRGIIDRIGHFTHGDDAETAYEFVQDVDRVHHESWKIARPNGLVNIPIGPCFADDCPGTLFVTIDRDRSTEAASLTLWRPVATCHTKDAEGKFHPNGDHQIDARLYAKDREQHADEERMTTV